LKTHLVSEVARENSTLVGAAVGALDTRVPGTRRHTLLGQVVAGSSVRGDDNDLVGHSLSWNWRPLSSQGIVILVVVVERRIGAS